MTIGVVAKEETTGTSATSASYDTLLPMIPKDVNVLIDGTTLSATSVEVSIENPVDEPVGLGSDELVAEPDRNGVLKVTATIEVYFSDFTEYDKFKSDTDVDVQIVADNGTESLTYNLDKARIRSFAVPVQGRERLKGTIEAQSYFNSTATENCQIVLVNNNATP